ncbi:alanine racemase [Microbacterium marinilacus]|uniref:Alanine racemase n=1 Tax=Microbacterium marinilacus TaxID=415209 RepID=A0ABP7BC68_9MICO|nr:alanine racemase [Microbacterium marinilacus]MBY0689399.1 alanine racemase [Microbacterium marinilacus]
MTGMREARIDLAAVTHNTRTLRDLAGTRELIAVVKADAYGHGAADVARAALAGGATRLGVADIREAIALRDAGIEAPVLAWLHDPDETFVDAVARDVQVGVSSLAQLHAVARAAESTRAVVHLKLETGLGRNGIASQDWADVFREAARLEDEGRLHVEGLFSHLSNTSDDDDRVQVRRFEVGVAAAEAAGLRPAVRHIAATAAAIALPEARLDAVRIGIGLYGLSPFADRPAADDPAAGIGLRPAMTLRARVAAVRRVPGGQGVSYGYAHRTAAESTLALVPLGYADGVPRQASGAGPVVIGGARFTVAGRIAMDQFVVDVGDHPVAVGDEVVLFGDPAAGHPSAAEWASAAGTINYEIVTRIGPRVPRVRAEGASPAGETGAAAERG